MMTNNSTGGVISSMFNNNTTASPGGVADTSITPYGIFTTVIGILAVVLNGLLLIAMLRNTSTIFTSNGAYLVANVAIADLLTGLNSSLWGLQNAFRPPEALTDAMLSLYWTSIEASFLTIFVMSLERYIAIVFPFTAEVWLSKTRTIQSCVVVWIFSAVCGACITFSRFIASFCLMVVFEITILFTTFLYYKIFIKLGQRRGCLPSLQLTSARGTCRNAELQREYQLTTVVVALTFILIVTVLPYMVGGQIMILAGRLPPVTKYPKLQLFLHYYLPVELMNFVFNPIVYAWRLPKYRFALLQTLQFR